MWRQGPERSSSVNASEQDEVVAYLRDAAPFGDGPPAEVVETHGAYVFLSGREALKMKRAVPTTTWTSRRSSRASAMLARELELNAPPRRRSTATWCR